jgi:predicted phosphoribosyltransferase
MERSAMSFHDRRDAGRQLARALQDYRDQRPVILALPRGGVPVAEEVANALDAPLDLVFVREVGTPGNPELAMGAVAARREAAVVHNPEILAQFGVYAGAFEAACLDEFAEIERRRAAYLGGVPQPPLSGKVAIVVDDGVATGATTRAALRAIRAERPAKLVLAVPVGPAETLDRLAGEADAVVYLEAPSPFVAVGVHYAEFPQVSDQEVAAVLARSAARRAHPRHAFGSRP